MSEAKYEVLKQDECIEFLRYLKIDLQYEPAIPLLGILPNKMKSTSNKMSNNWWLDKENLVYYETLMNYKQRMKLCFATKWITLKTIMLSEIIRQNLIYI